MLDFDRFKDPPVAGGSGGYESDARAPLRSRFPGELVLRDLPPGSPRRVVNVVTARFAVMQLAERYAAGFVADDWLEEELEAAAAYLKLLQRNGLADLLRLRHLLERMREQQPERVATGLLAAGDTALTQAHVFGSIACYRAAHMLAERVGRNAIALSAASRLADLAIALQKPGSGRRWQRECAALLAACH